YSRILSAQKARKLCRKLFHLEHLVLDGANERQLQPYFLILEFWPEDPRCIEQLHILIQADPLFALRHSGLVSCLCARFASQGIDEGRLSHIRDPRHHSADRTVEDASLAVPLHLFPARLLDNGLDRL